MTASWNLDPTEEYTLEILYAECIVVSDGDWLLVAYPNGAIEEGKRVCVTDSGDRPGDPPFTVLLEAHRDGIWFCNQRHLHLSTALPRPADRLDAS